LTGVHAGHQKILSELVRIAQENNGTSIVLTYRPNTKVYFGAIDESDLIYTEKQKLQKLQDMGVDVCVVLDIAKIKHMTANEFVADVLVGDLGIKHLVIGYDTNFGSDQKGDKKNIHELSLRYQFLVTEVLPVYDSTGNIISSTQNRKK
jgi:riboflavin kinase/FMN adenylyltransferase